MKKLPILLAAFFFLTTIALIYLFVFRGKVSTVSEDGRAVIELSKGNTDFALAEMRGFLESVQQINEGILNKNVEQIKSAAKKSGGSVIEHAPKGMMASLPIEFKKLGFSTHDLFDEIANSIQKNKSFNQTQHQLSRLLNNCVTCHKSYKIEVASQ